MQNFGYNLRDDFEFTSNGVYALYNLDTLHLINTTFPNETEEIEELREFYNFTKEAADELLSLGAVRYCEQLMALCLSDVINKEIHFTLRRVPILLRFLRYIRPDKKIRVDGKVYNSIVLDEMMELSLRNLDNQRALNQISDEDYQRDRTNFVKLRSAVTYDPHFELSSEIGLAGFEDRFPLTLQERLDRDKNRPGLKNIG